MNNKYKNYHFNFKNPENDKCLNPNTCWKCTDINYAAKEVHKDELWTLKEIVNDIRDKLKETINETDENGNYLSHKKYLQKLNKIFNDINEWDKDWLNGNEYTAHWYLADEKNDEWGDLYSPRDILALCAGADLKPFYRILRLS